MWLLETDSTSESWTYDADGNPLNHTDANGSTVANIYDNADRQTGINYPTGTDTTFSYDNANRRTGMIDRTGTTTWSFDNANRLTQIAAPAGTVSYTYDNANRRTGVTLTGTGSWTYAYDNADRLSQLTTPYTENSYYYYDNANRLTQLNAGNSSITTYTYDNANRTTEVQHQTSGHATLGDYQYQYNGASDVTQRTDNDGSITTFGYDGADQLTSEARTGTGAYSIGYTYDHNGNRLTKVQGGVTDTYTYDNHDKLQSTSSKSYTYDYNGNVKTVTVGGVTTTLTYDYDNQVTGLSGGSASDSFVYNGLGLRVSKTDASGTHAFVTDGSDVASAVLSDGAAVYTPGLSERRSGASKFYHTDALGSTRGITNSSQTATDSILYDAFGMTVSRTGTTPTPFGFVGSADYQTDSDTGLLLLGHRYYDPSIGRFITQDPIGAGNNWDEYCDNDPLNGVDPKGLVKDEVLDEINKAIGRGDLPRSTRDIYNGDKDLKREIHDEIGRVKRGLLQKDPKTGKVLSNPKLPYKKVIEVVEDYIPNPEGGTETNPEGGNEPTQIVGTGLVAVGTGYLIWQGVKWTAAILAAPETAGTSLILAGATP